MLKDSNRAFNAAIVGGLKPCTCSSELLFIYKIKINNTVGWIAECSNCSVIFLIASSKRNLKNLIKAMDKNYKIKTIKAKDSGSYHRLVKFSL